MQQLSQQKKFDFCCYYCKYQCLLFSNSTYKNTFHSKCYLSCCFCFYTFSYVTGHVIGREAPTNQLWFLTHPFLIHYLPLNPFRRRTGNNSYHLTFGLSDYLEKTHKTGEHQHSELNYFLLVVKTSIVTKCAHFNTILLCYKMA